MCLKRRTRQRYQAANLLIVLTTSFSIVLKTTYVSLKISIPSARNLYSRLPISITTAASPASVTCVGHAEIHVTCSEDNVRVSRISSGVLARSVRLVTMAFLTVEVSVIVLACVLYKGVHCLSIVLHVLFVTKRYFTDAVSILLWKVKG